jgi:hypothetical protein
MGRPFSDITQVVILMLYCYILIKYKLSFKLIKAVNFVHTFAFIIAVNKLLKLTNVITIFWTTVNQ